MQGRNYSFFLVVVNVDNPDSGRVDDDELGALDDKYSTDGSRGREKEK